MTVVMVERPIKPGEVPEHVAEVLAKLINTYNKYHAPEAVARLEKIEALNPENDLYLIRVRFKGSFCTTCGIRDWVEDLAYLGESLGIEARLEEVIEPEGVEDERVGYFIVKVPNPAPEVRA